ncbi:Protein of unknown function [Geodermatophilus dictyosporus]|uniref:Pvc16 N-terminal domain-containing protein n=1 Tax=Geodermatophilus dictyosporus TaxID=1523247 RepID=A0A1I5JPG3_9ACTN|nr:DUF4255 domain-containing protein [Geodermatophilus dictyosporus]SFO74600.1 Protein of unknown function [Geodermatophilus dictyosporus]
MADFGGVAAVGKSIEAVLRAGFAAVQPIDGTLTTAQLIGTDDLRPPAPRITRPALSVLLYRVDFNKTLRAAWAAAGSTDGSAHLPLDLHYLLTAWGENPEAEHRIIGRALQVLESLGGFSGPLLQPGGRWSTTESVQLYLEDMPTEDLMRTFDSLQCEFRLSIPYIARVVVISTPGTTPDPVLTSVRGARTGVVR